MVSSSKEYLKEVSKFKVETEGREAVPKEGIGGGREESPTRNGSLGVKAVPTRKESARYVETEWNAASEEGSGFEEVFAQP